MRYVVYTCSAIISKFSSQLVVTSTSAQLLYQQLYTVKIVPVPMSVSFFLFSPIHTAQCKFVITCNQGIRGGRLFDLKSTVDKAVKSCPSVRHVFVAKRTNNSVPMGKLDIPLDEVNHTTMTSCKVQRLESQIRNIL